MDIETKIKEILNDYNQKDLVPSAKAWELWQAQFFNKVKTNETFINEWETIKLIKKNDINLTEKEFNNYFPKATYSIQYINPLEYKKYTLSNKARNKIGLKLSILLPMNWDILDTILKSYYRGTDWTYYYFEQSFRMFNKQGYNNYLNMRLKEFTKEEQDLINKVIEKIKDDLDLED